jgi:hypothetical protein
MGFTGFFDKEINDTNGQPFVETDKQLVPLGMTFSSFTSADEYLRNISNREEFGLVTERMNNGRNRRWRCRFHNCEWNILAEKKGSSFVIKSVNLKHFHDKKEVKDSSSKSTNGLYNEEAIIALNKSPEKKRILSVKEEIFNSPVKKRRPLTIPAAESTIIEPKNGNHSNNNSERKMDSLYDESSESIKEIELSKFKTKNNILSEKTGQNSSSVDNLEFNEGGSSPHKEAGIVKPSDNLKVGLVFDTLDQCDEIVEGHALNKGFDLGKKTIKKGPSQRKYVCTSILSAYNKCQWTFVVSQRDDGKYISSHFNPVHNHSFAELDRDICTEFTMNVYNVQKDSRKSLNSQSALWKSPTMNIENYGSSSGYKNNDTRNANDTDSNPSTEDSEVSRKKISSEKSSEKKLTTIGDVKNSPIISKSTDNSHKKKSSIRKPKSTNVDDILSNNELEFIESPINSSSIQDEEGMSTPVKRKICLKIGQHFDTLEEVDRTVSDFANEIGFDLGRKTQKQNELQRVYSCTSVVAKVNRCKWKYVVIQNEDGKFESTDFLSEHNHSFFELDREKCKSFTTNVYNVSSVSRNSRNSRSRNGFVSLVTDSKPSNPGKPADASKEPSKHVNDEAMELFSQYIFHSSDDNAAGKGDGGDSDDDGFHIDKIFEDDSETESKKSFKNKNSLIGKELQVGLKSKNLQDIENLVIQLSKENDFQLASFLFNNNCRKVWKCCWGSTNRSCTWRLIAEKEDKLWTVILFIDTHIHLTEDEMIVRIHEGDTFKSMEEAKEIICKYANQNMFFLNERLFAKTGKKEYYCMSKNSFKYNCPWKVVIEEKNGKITLSSGHLKHSH